MNEKNKLFLFMRDVLCQCFKHSTFHKLKEKSTDKNRTKVELLTHKYNNLLIIF